MMARTTPAATSTSTRRRRSCSSSSTLFSPGWVPLAYLAVNSDIPGWIAARDKVLACDFAYHVGGHLGRAGTRADALVQKGYMQDLRAASKRSTSRRRVIRCRARRFCKGRLSS
jgi:hypothetical protein